VFTLTTLTLSSLGIIGWFKFKKEKKRSNQLLIENMSLTMENYNLNVRLSKIVSFDRDSK
jgi:hypothetical protein